jgi:arginase
VAVGAEYECHACGREFRAGLVRVPRAWGKGGEEMAGAALLPLPYPEAAIVAEGSLAEQNLALAADLPVRPIVLGGCCCAHVGAVTGLAARHDRVAVVWLDAHGDLNTPETSPTGNAWGMPLRMLIDSGTIRPDDVLLYGARNLDPPEQEFIAGRGIATSPDDLGSVLSVAEGVYAAFDADVLEPTGDVKMFMPEDGGPSLDEAAEVLERVAQTGTVVGLGFTGLRPEPGNVAPLVRLAGAIGL